MSIPWFAALDPLIDDGVNECDVLFIRDRPIRQKVAFTIILFAAYLKRTGDFASAFRLYTSLLRWKPLKAEGHLGLADISHLLADWKLELAPYKAEGIYPNPSLAAEGDTQDYVWRMDEFSHEDAQNHYQIASEELPASAFPLLHLSKVLISQGNMHEAMKVIDKAADLAADNRLVELNRAYVHGLTGQSGWEDIYAKVVSKSVGFVNRQPSVVRAKIVSTREAAAQLGLPVTEMTPEETLSYSFEATVDGITSNRHVKLHFPAPVAADFPDVADLGCGLKLVAVNYLLGDSRGLHSRQAKMFCPDILVHNDEVALIKRPNDVPRATSNRGCPILLPGRTFNYYHWMFDSLGSLCLYSNHSLIGEREVLSSLPLQELHTLSLELIREQYNLRFVRQLNSFTFDQATHIQYPSQFNIPHPAVIRQLRSRLSRHSLPKSGKRVYITRKGIRGRAVENEEVIEKRLRKAGFSVCDPGKMSLDEQIDFFSDVEALAAAPGAALTNLIFCPSEMKLLILASGLHHFETFTVISGTIGQPTYACFGASQTQPNPFFLWSVFSYMISEGDLAAALSEAGLI